MLTRRSLRIKVMQQLYAAQQDPATDTVAMQANLRKSIKATERLYLYMAWLTMRVINYIPKDVQRRKEMLRPSPIDKLYDTRLVDNILTQTMLSDREFTDAVTANAIDSYISADLVKKLHKTMADSDKYIEFLKIEQPDADDYRNILLWLVRDVILVSEDFHTEVENLFVTWLDDILGNRKLLLKKIKRLGKTEDANFNMLDQEADKQAWTEWTNFALQLFVKTHNSKTETLELLAPHLKNWDVERVSKMDIILIRMAVCELLEFPKIPVKVTINEYIEIAKMYSTPKSKDFVNGVLDKVMKRLKEAGKINKQGRGLINT